MQVASGSDDLHPAAVTVAGDVDQRGDLPDIVTEDSGLPKWTIKVQAVQPGAAATAVGLTQAEGVQRQILRVEVRGDDDDAHPVEVDGGSRRVLLRHILGVEGVHLEAVEDVRTLQILIPLVVRLGDDDGVEAVEPDDAEHGEVLQEPGPDVAVGRVDADPLDQIFRPKVGVHLEADGGAEDGVGDGDGDLRLAETLDVHVDLARVGGADEGIEDQQVAADDDTVDQIRQGERDGDTVGRHDHDTGDDGEAVVERQLEGEDVQVHDGAPEKRANGPL